MNYRKYPRTPHLSYSQSASADDVWFDSQNFLGKEVVVTEKVDGESSTLYTDHLHARSIDSKHHPSRNWIKQFHATIAHNIPSNMRICGENMFAFHSILYMDLPTYFLVYGIYEDDRCLNWDDTLEICDLLDLTPVPTIYRGVYNEELIKKLWTGKGEFPTFATQSKTPQSLEDFYPTTAEGYVVRTIDSFAYDDFAKHIAKYVRAGHVQTDEHWLSKPVIPNVLVGETLKVPNAR